MGLSAGCVATRQDSSASLRQPANRPLGMGLRPGLRFHMLAKQTTCPVCLGIGARQRYAEAEDGGIRPNVFDVNCPRCRRFTITRNAIRIIHERYEDCRESIAAFVIPRAHGGKVIDSDMLGES